MENESWTIYSVDRYGRVSTFEVEDETPVYYIPTVKKGHCRKASLNKNEWFRTVEEACFHRINTMKNDIKEHHDWIIKLKDWITNLEKEVKK